jgi:hypothetical protein
MRWLIPALAALATPALAQVTPMLPGVSEKDREYFRSCRAAIFFHLDEGAERRTVPVAVAEAMRGQMTFIMSETLREAPSGSLAQGADMLNFAENFFLSFSASLRANVGFATDVAAREARLIECQPMIWAIMGEHIDRLLAIRESMEGR